MNQIEIINDFKSRNKALEKTLIPEFITEKYLSKFPLHILEYCSNYKEVQEIIMKLTNTELDILSKIINLALERNYDWIPPANSFIKILKNPNYKDFCLSIQKEEFINQDIENMLFLIHNYGNFYQIKSYLDLKNIEAIRNSELAKFVKTEDPNIILLIKYGLSYDETKKIYKRFGRDLEYLPDCEEKEFLKDIDNIIHGRGTKDKKYNNLDFINNISSKLRNLFVNIYNRELFKINESTTKIGELSYNNKNIAVYDAGIDFTMSIYSYGLASDATIPDNYYTDWNRPLASDSNFCNSIITSASMRTSIKCCVFGFDNFEINDLQLVAANDLGTNKLERTVNVTDFYNEEGLIANVEFRIPEEIVNYTRYTNNEVYRSRRRVIENKLQKVNPDYIVYFKQRSDIPLNIDPIWHESVKAAADFSKNNQPLPIVVIDCEKCLLHNLEKIEKLISNFENSYDDISLLKKIIENIFTLSSGYNKNEYLYEKYFQKERMLEYFERLLNHIIKLSDIVPNIALSNINLFIDTMDLEYIKNLASPYWINISTNGQGLSKPASIYEALYKQKAIIEEKIKIRNEVTNNINL